MQTAIIKKYFEAANNVVIHEMYLKEFSTTISIDSLKDYNPGHLGTSMSINFILANLYYFFNKTNNDNQIIIGTGHAGASLIANLWLNGTLEKYDKKYSKDKKGLNNLITDFGSNIRSEINPEYPETIYDGGELGYSLGVAYGYALGNNNKIIPCIIGDGEAETGSITSAWQLARNITTNSKVLPIINLNNLKMNSKSYLSMMSDEELVMYFTSLGYKPIIIDAINENIDTAIENMQNSLYEALNIESPLIILKTLKGFTLKDYAGTIAVHKNPLQNNSKTEKLQIVKNMLSGYNSHIFDECDKLLPLFDEFKVATSNNIRKEVKLAPLPKTNNIDEYLYELLKNNNGIVFSPDEIISNKFDKCSNLSIEILNENLLQALYQGYTMSGNIGYYVAYEGFMPIISSMITQYYKYLKQSDLQKRASINSLNYILTSTCWENTYSHQNPDFVNALYEKNDKYYNIVYPKDTASAIACLDEFSKTTDKINILTISKRHTKNYDNVNTTIEVIKEETSPDLILCATGDYMLDTIVDVAKKIDDKKIKIIYVTKPQILSTSMNDSLSDCEFTKYFPKNTPVIYLYCGYPNIIKSLLYDRNIDCDVYGYDDAISVFGSFKNNAISNNVSVCDILNISKEKIKIRKKEE